MHTVVEMDIEDMGKVLIILGATLLVVGLVVTLAGRVGFIGKLPGDMLFQKGNVTFYFPIITMLVVSVVLTILVNLIGRLFR